MGGNKCRKDRSIPKYNACSIGLWRGGLVLAPVSPTRISHVLLAYDTHGESIACAIPVLLIDSK